jgi:hypothetical protein
MSLGKRRRVGLSMLCVPQVLFATGLSISALLAFWGEAHR